MELLVLDSSFKSIAIVDSYESLIWTERYFEVGDFELYVPNTPEALDTLKVDNYLWSKESDYIMVIEDIHLVTNVEEGNKILVSGRSLESILDRRIIWSKFIFSGNLQIGLQNLLNENIINPLDVDRKVNNFIFETSTDQRIVNLTHNEQVTRANLLETIRKICLANNIGFSLKLNAMNQLVFRLYFGVDRTYSQSVNPYVVFSSSFDTLISSEYSYSKRYLKTIALVAGEGEDLDRKTTIVGGGTGLDRRELYTDARDIAQKVDDVELTDADYRAQLEQRGISKLSEHIVKKAFDAVAETNLVFKYGTDFFMGDLVQFIGGDGTQANVRVVELIRSKNKSGVETYPKFSMEDINEYDTSGVLEPGTGGVDYVTAPEVVIVVDDKIEDYDTNVVQPALLDKVSTSELANYRNTVDTDAAISNTIGQYDTNVIQPALNEKLDPSDLVAYSTTEQTAIQITQKVSAIRVGGNNMLSGSDFENHVFDLASWNIWVGGEIVYEGSGSAPVFSGKNMGLLVPPNQQGGVYRLITGLIVGEIYTVSMWFYGAGGQWRFGTEMRFDDIDSSANWHRVFHTFTATNSQHYVYITTATNPYNRFCFVDNVQFELGNVATAWKLATSDTLKTYSTTEQTAIAITQKVSEIRVGGNNMLSGSDFELDSDRSLWSVHTGDTQVAEGSIYTSFQGKNMKVWVPAGVHGGGVYRYVSGLIIGEAYTMSAYVLTDGGDWGISTSGEVGNMGWVAGWRRVHHTFVATSTEHIFYLLTSTVGVSGKNLFVDNVQFEKGNVVSDWKLSNYDTLKNYSTVQQTSDKVALEIGNVKIGGTNLVLNGKVDTAGSAYPFASRSLVKQLEGGKTYTFTVRGVLNSEAVANGFHMACYLNNGAWTWASTLIFTTGLYETKSVTFTMPFTDTIMFGAYFAPANSSPGWAHVDWVQVEEGNKATDFSYALNEMRTARYEFTIDSFKIKNNSGAEAFSAGTDGKLKILDSVTVGAGAGNAGLNGAGSAGTDIRIWAGWATPSTSADFYVRDDGYMKAARGVIAGWSVNYSKIEKGAIILDATNERIYIGIGYFYNYGSGIIGVTGPLRCPGITLTENASTESLYPSSDNTYNLGASPSSQRWKYIYLINSPSVTSDIRSKSNIEVVEDDFIDMIFNTEVITYNLLEQENRSIGINANAFHAIFKEKAEFVVHQSEDGYYGADYVGFVPMLIKTVQQLNKRIQALEKGA